MTNILKTGYYIFSTIFGIAQIIAIIGLIIWGIAKLIKLFKKNNLTKKQTITSICNLHCYCYSIIGA